MALKIATQPAVEPVSLADAKDYCRVDDSAYDSLITTLITVARSAVEQYLRRALITQTWDLWLDGPGRGFPDPDRIIIDSTSGYAYTGGDWPSAFIEVPLSPLQSITNVYFYQDNDVQQTWAATNYILDVASEPGRIVLKRGQVWPQVLRPGNGLQIRFVAGYGGAGSNVPAPITQALKLMIGHWLENRESQDMPPMAARMLDQYRIMRLGR